MCACSAVTSEAVASMSFGSKARVSIYGVDNGEQYCFPGPASAENGWTVPGEAFQVEHILGRRLICLEKKAPNGNMVLKRQADNEFALTDKVMGVRTTTGDIADKKMDLILAADSNKRVWVYCGVGILRFRGISNAETVPPADLSGISTPPTPPLYVGIDSD